MKRKAFTLIELLVVIAIIAILAAILFPVFAQAKEAAKKTQSISNMKQFGTSVMIYLADYDDTMPQSAFWRPTVSGPQIVSVYDVLQPYMKNLNILVSPNDQPGQSWTARLNALGLQSDVVQRASYIPNLGLFGENLCGLPIKTAFTPVTQHSSLENPVGTIMFFDGYIRTGVPALDYWTFMAQPRHAEGLVMNFADSHARFYRWNGIPDGGATPAGSRATTYYGWRRTEASCPSNLCRTNQQLQAVSISPTNPYNDLHGVPGTAITDSEDTNPCP